MNVLPGQVWTSHGMPKVHSLRVLWVEEDSVTVEWAFHEPGCVLVPVNSTLATLPLYALNNKRRVGYHLVKTHFDWEWHMERAWEGATELYREDGIDINDVLEEIAARVGSDLSLPKVKK